MKANVRPSLPVLWRARGTPSSISFPLEKSRGWRADGRVMSVDVTHFVAKAWRLSARHRGVFSAPGRASGEVVPLASAGPFWAAAPGR